MPPKPNIAGRQAGRQSIHREDTPRLDLFFFWTDRWVWAGLNEEALTVTQRKLAFALVVINNTEGRQELVNLLRCIHPSSWCKSETDNNRESVGDHMKYPCRRNIFVD
jgi:hypothetical protein